MDWFDIFGGSGADFVPTSSDFVGAEAATLADFLGEMPDYSGDMGGFSYGSDAVAESGDGATQRFSILPRQTAYEAYYGEPSSTSDNGGVAGVLDNIGKYFQTPGGKLVAGLGGAGLGALGAMKQRAAQKKLQALMDARRAESLKYSSPITPTFSRSRVDPTARQGASLWYSGNNVALPKAAEGGSTNPDAPSFIGFLRYVANGKKLPSEVLAQRASDQQARQKRAQQALEGGVQPVSLRDRMDAAAAASGEQVQERATGGYMQGGTPGQSDKIPAMLSDGEYVMDADVVSALGDGNNAAGAAKLDQMRNSIRTHKRSAPANKIPPKAKSPLAYMKKGAK